MKRHGNLYEKIITKENIALAYKRARRGKAWQRKVQKIDRDKERYLEELRLSLVNKTFHTAPYRLKWIYEPKQRLIYILPFYPDRIVQHALMQVLIPIWEPMMIFDSYACREGKGQHRGSNRALQFAQRNEYCLQCDISKFYPSIDHEILKAIIRKKIKDPDTLWLIDDIIDSIEGNTNAPIGNYTSQWFGNMYLNELDTKVKHDYKIRDYIRYCDDFLFFSNDKEQLKFIQSDIAGFLGTLKLKLSKANLFHTTQGVDFLGYRHFHNRKLLVRKRTAGRIRRNIKAVPFLYRTGRITARQAVSKLASAKGWLQFAHTRHLRESMDFDHLWDEVRTYQ